MPADYSRPAFTSPNWKGAPKLLDKREKDRETATTDRKENAKARKRACGYCEVRELHTARCYRRDTQTHHLLGGIGRRNKGRSILAAYKLRVCDECHREITGHVLQPTTAEHDATTVRYRRRVK